MKIKDLPNCPEWLSDADTINEDVEMINNTVVWNSGTWQGGTWQGGVWKNGTWQGGIWEEGIWKNGTWRRGVWKGGIWRNGAWHGGVWKGGIWKNGTWLEGVWKGGIWQGGTWLAVRENLSGDKTMTRKDHVRIARAVAYTRPEPDRVEAYGCWKRVCEQLAMELAGDNPRFDKDRFVKATEE